MARFKEQFSSVVEFYDSAGNSIAIDGDLSKEEACKAFSAYLEQPVGPAEVSQHLVRYGFQESGSTGWTLSWSGKTHGAKKVWVAEVRLSVP